MRTLAMKEEIKSHDWKLLCERIGDFEGEQLVTVEVVEHDGTRREIGRALLLKSLDFQPLDACNDAIRLRAADGFDHVIIEPLHVRLIRNAGGGFNPVEIDAEAGSTILHFKPALKPVNLEGLARVGWAGAPRSQNNNIRPAARVG